MVATPEALVTDAPLDWVLVAPKTTALAQARSLVEPLLSDDTGIVVMCNGLGIEDSLRNGLAGADLRAALLHRRRAQLLGAPAPALLRLIRELSQPANRVSSP